MKKLFFVIFFSALFTTTPAMAGSDSAVFSIHGVLGASPCSVSVADLTVPLEDADVTELEKGLNVFGANFLIPFTCSSAANIVLQFNGNHGSNARLLYTTQQSVALTFECKNAYAVNLDVILGEAFNYGTSSAAVRDNVTCKAFYKKITGKPTPSPGPLNASLTMTININ